MVELFGPEDIVDADFPFLCIQARNYYTDYMFPYNTISALPCNDVSVLWPIVYCVLGMCIPVLFSLIYSRCQKFRS